VKVVLFGHEGQVGSVLAPALAAAGHEVLGVGSGDQADLDGVDAAIDFTTPEAVERNVRACLEQEVPCVVGTTGWDPEPLSRLAEEREVQLFYASNFALGAVLMMRFAAEAAEHLPKAEIIELHSDKKKDAPSGTAKATAERLGGAPIHSVRLPGLVAHQAVLLGGDGQLLTIRHDAFSREAYVPGVLLALERLTELPPGVTVGLEMLLD
jgi:4-hydroxy-tetrahydrodipicolinate reductase